MSQNVNINISLPGGMAGLQFLNDIIYLFNNKWIQSNGGPKPTIVKLWELKETGMADSDYSVIAITIDSENPQIYSMLQGNGGDPKASSYDWLHEVSITMDIRAGKSENRVLQMVNETMRILKTNTVPVINNTQYIQLLPEGVTSLNEEYRSMFRMLISVSAIRFNP